MLSHIPKPINSDTEILKNHLKWPVRLSLHQFPFNSVQDSRVLLLLTRSSYQTILDKSTHTVYILHYVMIPTCSVSLPLSPLYPTSHCSHISLSNLAPCLTLSCFICFRELVVNACESKQLICLDTGSRQKNKHTYLHRGSSSASSSKYL